MRLYRMMRAVFPVAAMISQAIAFQSFLGFPNLLIAVALVDEPELAAESLCGPERIHTVLHRE